MPGASKAALSIGLSLPDSYEAASTQSAGPQMQTSMHSCMLLVVKAVQLRGG